MDNKNNETAMKPLPKAVGLAKDHEKGFFADLYQEVTGRTIEQTIKEAKDNAKRRIFESIGEFISDQVDDFFLGGKRPKSGKSYSYGASVVRIDNPSYAAARPAATKKPSQASKYTFEDLLFHTRSEAVDFKDNMIAAIAETGKPVTVAMVYDAMDDPSNMEPTDNFYGWYDLRNAYVKREYSGLYRLYLPEPVQIH